jgi:hypothetical protein
LVAVLVACTQQAGPAKQDPLRAASTPGWRITQVLPNLTIGGVWAGGPRDAWLAGDACADPATCGVSDTGNGTVAVLHWDGASWRGVRPPKAYVNTPLDQGAGPVAATSASNVWIAAYRGLESVDYTDMLHWTGQGWAAPVRLPTAIQAAVAPSAVQLWAFGDGTTSGQFGYVAHLTGKTWTSGWFPLAGTAAAALSPSDVWVGGTASMGQPGIDHWDGRRWQVTPLPDLGRSTSTVLGLAVEGIAAVGPDDVWADISEGTSPILLHWNGKSWARAAVPYAGLELVRAAGSGTEPGVGPRHLLAMGGRRPGPRQRRYRRHGHPQIRHLRLSIRAVTVRVGMRDGTGPLRNGRKREEQGNGQDCGHRVRVARRGHGGAEVDL